MSLNIIIFSSMILISMLDLFIIGTRGAYVSRTFIDLPLTLVKSCVATYEYEDETYAYFDKPIFEEEVIHYLNTNLKDEVDIYKISFFYYKMVENEYQYDLSNEPKNVQLHFNCNFYKTFEVNKYLTFEIEKIWG
ncbi:MAG: hypothetical protein SOV26_00880 [Candidatus Onthovivens sp.]|nr:hypothetical protein [Candidatus Onthovivens sp.]